MKYILTAIFALSHFLYCAAQPPLTILPGSTLNTFGSANPDSLFMQWKERLSQYEQSNNRAGVAICLQHMAQALFHLGNYTESIERFLKADNIFRQLKEERLLAQNLNLTGTVYYYNQQPAEAFQQFAEALSIYKLLKDPEGLASTYGQIGHYYEKQENYDSALYYGKFALNYAASVTNKSIIAKIYENIGSIYEDRLKFDSARSYFERSLALNRQLNNHVSQIEVLNNLGDLHRKKGEYAKGLEFARRAMNLALATQEKYQLQSAYRDIALNYNFMGRNDSAFRYLLLSRDLVQDLYSSENSKQITLLQSLHDTERKNAEIIKLNAIRKSNTIFIIAVGGGAILLSLLAGVIISKQRQKIRIGKELTDRNQEIYLKQKELMESEMKVKQMEEERLKHQLETKTRELSSHILHLIQKNETLEELKTGLTQISQDDKRDQKKQVRHLLQKINVSASQDAYWNDFRLIFDQVHQSFFSNLSKNYPELSASELKLLALLKMNLNSGDISTLLGVAQDSLRVMRYRIKKKINLQPEESLSAFIQSL